MKNVTIFEHPVISHKLTYLRDINTGSKQFRDLVSEISMLMAYEVTRDFELEDIEIETPLEKTVGKILTGKKVAIVPVLRAGLGMVDGILNILPAAKVGHVGLYRDEETLEPHFYYAKFPSNIAESMVMIVDPMLATGGSAVAAIDRVKQAGAKDIRLVCLVGVQEGIDAVEKAHPDVEIYLASKDEKLNEIGYIVPGLGDAGDRIFGTK